MRISDFKQKLEYSSPSLPMSVKPINNNSNCRQLTFLLKITLRVKNHYKHQYYKHQYLHVKNMS